MLLSQTAEYALRAMAWLATVSGDEPVRAVDLSSATGIPTHYLSKVLRRLVLANLLESQKGQGGGFSLSLGVWHQPGRNCEFHTHGPAIYRPFEQALKLNET